MSKVDKKLEALSKTYDLKVQELQERYAKVEQIVIERKGLLGRLQALKTGSEKELYDLRNSTRMALLHRGYGGSVSSVVLREDRIVKNLEALAAEEKSRLQELAIAEQRAEMLREELLLLRIEQKKIEKVFYNKQQSERVIDAARDEVLSDELSHFMRRR